MIALAVTTNAVYGGGDSLAQNTVSFTKLGQQRRKFARVLVIVFRLTHGSGSGSFASGQRARISSRVIVAVSVTSAWLAINF
jgi:hypothetical protein